MSVRLTFQMIADLKKVADKLGRPYQAVMKEAIEKGLPIVRDIGEVVVKLRKDARTSTAVNIQAAVAKLKKARAVGA